jgi:MoaA/NifB/PqqE/SkfB family radical SAM enzyme
MKIGIFGGEYVHKHTAENFTPSWVQILSKKYDVTLLGSIDIDMLSLYTTFVDRARDFDQVIFVAPADNKLSNSNSYVARDAVVALEKAHSMSISSSDFIKHLFEKEAKKFLERSLLNLILTEIKDFRPDTIVINSHFYKNEPGLNSIKKLEEKSWGLDSWPADTKLGHDSRQCYLTKENNEILAAEVESWLTGTKVFIDINKYVVPTVESTEYFLTHEARKLRRQQYKNFESSATYCYYPFKEIAIKEYRGTELLAFWPCCMMGNQINDRKTFNVLDVTNPGQYTPQEMYDHPRMQLLRSNKLLGIRDKACETCWDQENRGLDSFRVMSKEPADIEDGLTEINDLYMIDMTASNICNLRCRMCTPSASNLLMMDYKYFEENNLIEDVNKSLRGRFYHSVPYKATESKQWSWLMENTDRIRVLKASGGEPLYDGKVIQLLQRYIETGSAQQTRLSFHTNATQFNDAVIDILSKFKSNEHTFSIDGADKVYEYIRYPATFDELETSVNNYITKLDNIANTMHFNCVVSSLNVLNLNSLFDWTEKISDNPFVNLSELYPPDRGTAVKHLPKHLLELARQRLEPYINTPKNMPNLSVINMITLLNTAINNNQENKELMLKEITLFDKSRNQNFKDFLDPALVEWLCR